MQPISFKHPFEDQLLAAFDIETLPHNAVLTGSAGDGKSHLSREIMSCAKPVSANAANT